MRRLLPLLGHSGGSRDAMTCLYRYGITTTARYSSGSRKWDRAQERFDLAKHPDEANRFGWIVEVDPFGPDAPATAATTSRCSSRTRSTSPNFGVGSAARRRDVRPVHLR